MVVREGVLSGNLPRYIYIDAPTLELRIRTY